MFTLKWTPAAAERYEEIRAAAVESLAARKTKSRKKSTKAEGLFKQVKKTLDLLQSNPKHPGLHTHEYKSLTFEFDHQKRVKVFEAYVQNNTPGAYRVFWCYGPEAGEITVIAITPHP